MPVSPIYTELNDGPSPAASSPVYAVDDVYPQANTLMVVEAGAIARTGPTNVVVLFATPAAVRIGWTSVTESGLLDDEHRTNDVNDRTPTSVGAPEDVTGHLRTVLGYKVHRGDPGFIPSGINAGEDNCVADQGTLGPSAIQYTDLDPPTGQEVAYLVGAVYDDGF